MKIMDKSYKYDSEIADLVYSIINNGTFKAETPNESILMHLYKLRGTPINAESNLRDNKRDYEMSAEFIREQA